MSILVDHSTESAPPTYVNAFEPTAVVSGVAIPGKTLRPPGQMVGRSDQDDHKEPPPGPRGSDASTVRAALALASILVVGSRFRPPSGLDLLAG
jgi:hypothetical protein